MCKVMIMSGIKDSTRDKALLFIEEMGRKLSVHNDDGLGYAAIDEDDNLFAERWTENHMAFKKITPNPFGSAITVINGEYNSYGKVALDKVKAITLHTRMATCELGIDNTHPFIKDGTSLIHNGVIRNPEVYMPTISTCDSESLLNGYMLYNLAEDPVMLEEMVAPLEGYWAAAVFAKLSGRYVLDIFKHSASLSVIFVEDLDTWVFSTQAADIKEVCTRLGFKYNTVGDVGDNVAMRLDPQTGEVIFTWEYEKVQKTYKKNYNSWEYGPDSSSCLTYSEYKRKYGV
jgi:hypothetical protein